VTLDIAIVLAVLVSAVALFASGRLPADLVALVVMVVLLLLGLISVEQALAGFSNSATITVGAMFILSAGLFKSGAVNFVGTMIVRVGRLGLWAAVVVLMVGVGAVSAFMNNTAAVAIFLPTTIGAAKSLNVSPGRLLMPLSFAAMFGGVCTLIGTSTNILVSSIAEEHELAPIGMFEMSEMGLIFFGAGVAYMLLVGVWLIPDRRNEGELDEQYGMGEYLVEVVVGPTAKSVGRALGSLRLARDTGVAILDLIRGGERFSFPPPTMLLAAGDVLRLRADVSKITAVQEREGIIIRPHEKWESRQLADGPTRQLEVIIAPSSRLRGRTLKQARFADVFGGMALAIRQHGRLRHHELEDTRLQSGDALLVEVPEDRVSAFRRSTDFVLVSEVIAPVFRRRLIIPAVAIVGGVVTLAAVGVVPILIGALVGSVLMVLTGCLTLEEAYASVDWKVIFLLAGVLTLGVAMENTGTAALLASLMVGSLGPLGPYAMVATMYLITSLITETMSNNATAVLLTPVAIAAAGSLGIDPRPLMMAVAFAASASFMTPMGYQTNMMIFSAGGFRFGDFVRVGTPLSVLFFILATVFIPVFWSF